MASSRCWTSQSMTASLADAFTAFCTGGKADTGMDGKSFAKLCKDCRLYSRGFTTTDADLIFKSLATNSYRRMNFEQFQHSLQLVARRKRVDVQDVHRIVAQVGRPVLAGTRSLPVRVYDESFGKKARATYGLREWSPERSLVQSKKPLNLWEEPLVGIEESEEIGRIRSRSISPVRTNSLPPTPRGRRHSLGSSLSSTPRRALTSPDISARDHQYQLMEEGTVETLLREEICDLDPRVALPTDLAIENGIGGHEAKATALAAEPATTVSMLRGSRQPHPQLPVAVQRADESPGGFQGKSVILEDSLREDALTGRSPMSDQALLSPHGQNAGAGSSEAERWTRQHLGHGAATLSCGSLSISHLNIAICNGTGIAETEALSTTIGSNGCVSSASGASGSSALVKLQVMDDPEVAVVVPCLTTIGDLAVEFGQGNPGPWQVHLLGTKGNSKKVLLSQQMTVGNVVASFRGPGSVPCFAVQPRRPAGACCKGSGCWPLSLCFGGQAPKSRSQREIVRADE